MKVSSITPSALEREFSIEELFFSTTDKRGVITSGNDVFARVSGYSLGEMIGQPHNIIRHPEMPRAVFKLLWEFLEAGKPIVAYVKNMANDGRYYWVLALALPIEGGGYLSVRLKPSTQTFQAVKDVYKELRDIELRYGDRGEQGKVGMETSYKRLHEILGSLGFSSYEEFMRKALVDEMSSRKAIIQNQAGKSRAGQFQSDSQGVVQSDVLLKYHRATEVDSYIQRLFAESGSFLELRNLLERNSRFISSVCVNLQLMSLNASVRSARYGESGATLGVVAERMGANSTGLKDSVAQAMDLMTDVDRTLASQSFCLAAATLFVEVATFFLRELVSQKDKGHDTGVIDHTRDIDLLSSLLAHHVGDAINQTDHLVEKLQALEFDIAQLGKVFRTLSFVRVIGKVEASRLDNSEAFVHLISNIIQHVEDAQRELSGLSGTLTSIVKNRVDVQPLREILRAQESQGAAA